MNLGPSGYEPDELPGCSTPRHVFSSKKQVLNWLSALLLVWPHHSCVRDCVRNRPKASAALVARLLLPFDFGEQIMSLYFKCLAQVDRYRRKRLPKKEASKPLPHFSKAYTELPHSERSIETRTQDCARHPSPDRAPELRLIPAFVLHAPHA